MAQVIVPAEGRYGIGANPPVPPSSLSMMTSGELATCQTSDDDRFMLEALPDPTYCKYPTVVFRFDFPEGFDFSTSVRICHEGYCVADPPCEGAYKRHYRLWWWDVNNWWGANILPSPLGSEVKQSYDTVVWAMPGMMPLPDPWGAFLDENNRLYVAIMFQPDDPTDGWIKGYTDRCWIPGISPRLRTAHNLSGQRFRIFDDADAGQVSFERLDHPGGAWSTPTQPFGEGSNSPDIECLADGRLRCALIDSDGNLQQFYSSDDGESWA